MMELIGRWLTGITCAALVVALAEGLTPEGAVRRVGRLVGGLVLMLAIVQPLVGLDYEALSAALTDYRFETGGYGDALEFENERLMEVIISDQTGAYIQDKAAGLGLTVTAAVSCAVGEDGVPYPVSVVITGELTEGEQAELARLIEGELAIPEACQQYERTDGG